ncbi:PH domain-containing protein [Myxococcus sp. RHSTA-1-4]|uniref:PH domain-containing protein n=1 Tax=Myxococcus sp. RHSTA-1-4 TaxID=2874601 RepID=UPI001CBE91B0|nr:PH domain-containing protein [Myxococcus sp. RHSTA-1-4]MBZ4422991.1 PH domain-containing protein [Myxococcus sp. RHSTA-1-4]
MAELPHAWLLRLLKVPPPPQLPSGDEGRVFRSAPGYQRYQLLIWGLRQLGVAAGLVAGALFIEMFIFRVNYPLADEIAWAIEGLAWAGFLVQLPIGFLVRRLDYAFRWYILSDRSLRVREGLVSLQEKTMTFANVQQVSLQQNPLQRLFGISDVKVETAGGGGSGGGKGSDGATREHMHEAYFRGVSNASEIRDAILARVRLHRDTGLGEPQAPEPVEPGRTSAAALEAARELLTEMRALRQALPPRQGQK